MDDLVESKLFLLQSLWGHEFKRLVYRGQNWTLLLPIQWVEFETLNAGAAEAPDYWVALILDNRSLILARPDLDALPPSLRHLPLPTALRLARGLPLPAVRRLVPDGPQGAGRYLILPRAWVELHCLNVGDLSQPSYWVLLEPGGNGSLVIHPVDQALIDSYEVKDDRSRPVTGGH